ncbi:MAG: helix-turn-helix transcriptional regulator [Cyanobacteria bacterium P01_F01_bin.150]
MSFPMPNSMPSNVTQALFDQTLDKLTPRQRSVLKEFLQGKTDEAIAQSLYLETSTIRRHLSNICKVFDLKSEPGERYSHRDELVDSFIQHKPSWIHPNHKLLKRPILRNSQLPNTSTPQLPNSSTDDGLRLSPNPSYATPNSPTPQLLNFPAPQPDFPGTPLTILRFTVIY